MDEADADARGQEDAVAAERLEGQDGAGGTCGVAIAAAPLVGDCLVDGKVSGAQERSADEEFVAVELTESVESVSAPSEVNGQVTEEKGSIMEENPEEPGVSAEPGNSWMCHLANGVLSSETSCVTRGRGLDVACQRDTLDKATESNQDGFPGNGGDVNTGTDDLNMLRDEAHCVNECLLDSVKVGSELCPRGIVGVVIMTDLNYALKRVDSMPKIEAEFSGRFYEDSVPSVSGRTDAPLDGNAGQVDDIISGYSATCHDVDGGLWNNGLRAPFGDGSQSKNSGCEYGMVDAATEGSQCEQDSLAGEGGALCDGVEVKTSLEDLQLCCKEPHSDNGGLPDSVKFDVMHLNEDVNHELEKDVFLPGIGEEVPSPMHEDSNPSSCGNCVAVSFDSKACEIGETSEHRTAMEKMACGSQRRGMLSCEKSVPWKEAPRGANQCSRIEASTSEDKVQTCWMEACHDNGWLSGLGKHDTLKLPRGADGLSLTTDAKLGNTGCSPNIDAELSCPVDEASVPSVYESPIDVPFDGKAGWVGEILDNKTCVKKLTYGSLDSRLEASEGLTSSLCKDANMASSEACAPLAEMEAPLKKTDQKYETSEFPPESDVTRSSYNQPCDEELCCSGRESTDLCLAYRDSAGVELGSSDHLAQDLIACNSVVDKHCSVDSVNNGNDGELQHQKPGSLIVFRRRNPSRAASSRNADLGNHGPMTKGNTSKRKSKKTKSASSLVQSSVIKFPNTATKGRSGINRPVKSTAWGSLQKLTYSFMQNCGPSSSSNLNFPEKVRSNKRFDEKKEPHIRKNRSSRCSKDKCAVFSGSGYASDELNVHPTFSVTTDTNASSEGCMGNFPKLAPNPLESFTQDTCPAYVHVVCAKSTSEHSLNNVDVGFSPDSVLEIASVTCELNTSSSHDVTLRENPSYPAALTRGDLHASDLSVSDFGSHASSSTDLDQRAKTVGQNGSTRKYKISPSHTIADNDISDGKVHCLEKSNAVWRNKSLGKQERQKKDGKKEKNVKIRSWTKISSSEALELRTFSNDSSSLGPSELLLSPGSPKFSSCFEAQTFATQDIGMHEQDRMQSPSVTKEKRSAPDNKKLPRRKKKDDIGGKKVTMRGTPAKGKSKKNVADGTSLDCRSCSSPSELATDLAASHTNVHSNLSTATGLALKNSAVTSSELHRDVACKIDVASVQQRPRAAWVCCDDCQKWRCIPAGLADTIGETNCKWTCKDNRDEAFADCSIPQEKTNAEINAELELSDASADEGDNDGSNSKALKSPSWTHIKSNLFLHRRCRTQSIDESMVCNCKPPQDGRKGCRDSCLNRILNIECTKSTCPCGEHCSNQQFQNRSYAKINWFHSGKKGYGLQLQEDVSEGQFLIEYVGEVLDALAYEARQSEYASKGQNHFYFMALNGGEVIDACTKGNLGRFINHSCSPNCRTEKWMVDGEVCIGIFAMKNLKKGEELTFDYNYVRVSRAAAQKCFCGTAKCRGYIGGEISGSCILSQDGEAEHFEPMADVKDSEEMLGANGSCSHGVNPDIVGHDTFNQREDSDECPPATPVFEPQQKTSDMSFDITEPENFSEALDPQDTEDDIRTPVHVSRTTESSLQQFPVYDNQPLDFAQKTPQTVDGSKAPNVANGSRRSSDSGSKPGFHANKKINVKHHKNVKPSPSPIDNEHILGVEGKLNSLLDGNGGISKRKDATNGYLKLLVLTAADGDNSTPKSIRDLSLILDALLKTKSHTVLLDIISKNGLQMLHNILKQNRKGILRTPIIRKLLKVLEFLASKGILTFEHINRGPPFAKTESFGDSMSRLCWHFDTQVQQIARNFRDRWIRRNMARGEPTEYLRPSTSSQDVQEFSTAGGAFSTANCSTDWASTRRKRKSRWDCQPDDHYKMVGLKIQKVRSQDGELNVQTGLMRNKCHENWGINSYHNDVSVMGSSTDGADFEVPPGFETRQEYQSTKASIDCAVAPSICQDRYLPNLSVSYGIPINLVEHFGTPEVEPGQCGKKWKVAPGVPFNPFPPLPPYPRGSPCPSTSSTRNSPGYSDRGGKVHRKWRNETRTRGPYNQGRRSTSHHHRFERSQPSSPEEHGE